MQLHTAARLQEKEPRSAAMAALVLLMASAANAQQLLNHIHADCIADEMASLICDASSVPMLLESGRSEPRFVEGLLGPTVLPGSCEGNCNSRSSAGCEPAPAACPGRGCDAGILLKNLICSGGPDLSDCDPQTAAAIEHSIVEDTADGRCYAGPKVTQDDAECLLSFCALDPTLPICSTSDTCADSIACLPRFDRSIGGTAGDRLEIERDTSNDDSNTTCFYPSPPIWDSNMQLISYPNDGTNSAIKGPCSLSDWTNLKRMREEMANAEAEGLTCDGRSCTGVEDLTCAALDGECWSPDSNRVCMWKGVRCHGHEPVPGEGGQWSGLNSGPQCEQPAQCEPSNGGYSRGYYGKWTGNFTGPWATGEEEQDTTFL